MDRFRLFLIVLVLTISGCGKESTDTPAPTRFDQKAMLANMADNLIVPAYSELSATAESLASAVSSFTAGPGAGSLESVQAAFKLAYKAYLHCEPYDFGPANGTVMLTNEINYWPTKPLLINAELSGSADLSDDHVAGLGAEKKGFPALAYLLFDISNGNAAVLDSFTNSTLAEKRKQYVGALAAHIANSAQTVLQEWNDGYTSTFKTNTGTELNSSLSLLLNNFVIYLEAAKNKRIGTPIGHKDNFSTGPIDPAALELPYSDFAKEALSETTVTLTNIYLGKSGTTDGAGFDDYAKSLSSDGAALNESIKTELNVFQNDVAAIVSPMQTSIQADVTPVYNSWVQSKKLLVLLKVDLASNLGILITFSDNDGD